MTEPKFRVGLALAFDGLKSQLSLLCQTVLHFGDVQFQFCQIRLDLLVFRCQVIFFLGEISSGKTIGQAVTTGRKVVRRASGRLRQRAEIDDDGDGVSNEKNVDGVLARKRYIEETFGRSPKSRRRSWIERLRSATSFSVGNRD